MPVDLKGISGTASKEESKRNNSFETNGSKTYQQPCHPVLRVMHARRSSVSKGFKV